MNIDSEKLAILDWMQIPVWVPRNAHNIAFDCSDNPARFISPIVSLCSDTHAPKKYLLLTGVVGEWEANTPAVQEAQAQMLKRLIQALGWQYEACVIGECGSGIDIEQSLDNLGSGFHYKTIEKVIVFGGIQIPSMSAQVIQIDAVAELMQNPAAKRKAWELLVPSFKV